MNQIMTEIKNLDQSILHLMKSGLRYTFVLMLISCMVLLTYNFIYPNPTVYAVGISLFKSSLFFIVAFIIFGFSFNKIKNDLRV
ncbi:MAG: hypothetical protein IJ777_03605 [Clostridia bacterium]|nr:hypothetical protein [Clostridia bacterium]